MDGTAIAVATIGAVAMVTTPALAAWQSLQTRRENRDQHGTTATLLAEHTEQDAERFAQISVRLDRMESRQEDMIGALITLTRVGGQTGLVGDGPALPKPRRLGRRAPAEAPDPVEIEST